METEVIEYREGDDVNLIRKTPGLQHGGPLVLKRIFCCNSILMDWYEAFNKAELDKKAMSLIFLSHKGEEKCRINFYECWPSAYSIETLESKKNAVSLEVIVIEYEWMEWA